MNTYKLATILELDVVYAQRIRRAARRAAWAMIKPVSQCVPPVYTGIVRHYPAAGKY